MTKRPRLLPRSVKLKTFTRRTLKCGQGGYLILSHENIYLFININQLDALNFIMSLFKASTCFEHMCSSSGVQNRTIQPLVSSY